MQRRHVGAINGQGQFVVIEEAVPEIKPGEVLVENKASLVSPGTEFLDVPGLRKTPDPKLRPEDKKFGYSGAGVIVKQGPGCEDLPVGLRVATMGWGSAYHSDYVVIPRNLLTPMPEGMTFDQATFAHLGATALHGIRRAQLEFGENVMVVGLGLVGQCALQLASASGTHVVAVDRVPLRLDVARKSGAELCVNTATETEEQIVAKVREFTRGHGIDCTFIAFGGNADAVIQLVRKVHKVGPDTHLLGRIVAPGLMQFSFTGVMWPNQLGHIDIRPSSRPGPGYKDAAWEHGREYTPGLVPWTSRRNMEEFLRFIRLGRIDVDKMVTLRLPFQEFSKGVEKLYASPNETLGVIFHYN